tara:strand:- start:1260 stop:1415 length:156 start_codon:yes stop_codon:yes gene_type:complete
MSKITRYQDLIERDHVALTEECQRIEWQRKKHKEIMRQWRRNGLAYEVTRL